MKPGNFIPTPSRRLGLAWLVPVLALFTQIPSGQAQTLVVDWAFDGNTLDSSGNGNDGTASGTISYVPGVFGGSAVYITGGAQVLNSAAANLPVLGSDSFSMNLWLNVPAPLPGNYIAGFGNWSNAGARSARGVGAYESYGGTGISFIGSYDDAYFNFGAGSGTWNMFTLTYDANSSQVTAYLNGSVAGAATIVSLADTTSSIQVAPNSTWTGSVDEFTVWRGVLDASQVNNLYVANDISAIPEPATFGVMFGAVSLLIGIGLRIRKTGLQRPRS